MGRKKRIGADAGAAENCQDDSAGADAALPSTDSTTPAPSGAAATLQTMLRANPQLSAQIATNPLLANQLTQIAQAASEPVSSTSINPDIQELADHFGLDERIAKQLNNEMKARTMSFEGDMIALWDILETARNPAGLLSVKIKEMQEGTFVGQPNIDKDIKEFQKMYRLDDQATRKLAEALQNRPATRKEDVQLLHRHLETSNNPSARVMMMLGKLRSGEPLGEPDKRVAPGSYVDRLEREKDRDKDRSRRSRDRDRREGGLNKRSRSRDRDRRRSRSRNRR